MQEFQFYMLCCSACRCSVQCDGGFATSLLVTFRDVVPPQGASPDAEPQAAGSQMTLTHHGKAEALVLVLNELHRLTSHRIEFVTRQVAD